MAHGGLRSQTAVEYHISPQAWEEHFGTLYSQEEPPSLTGVILSIDTLNGSVTPLEVSMPETLQVWGPYINMITNAIMKGEKNTLNVALAQISPK